MRRAPTIDAGRAHGGSQDAATRHIGAARARRARRDDRAAPAAPLADQAGSANRVTASRSASA
ncbi:hypothetical protein WL98_10100 [Burkholderia multivorans]|nr:hypothetical protein WL98_10100 [Burkholderia multivorans]